MKLANKWTSDLLGKDKEKSEAAAKHIINTPDLEAWNCLIENSEYIFSFIKEKGIQNIVKQINSDNYKNIFELFKYHLPEYDDYLAEKLSTFNDDELNNKLFQLLKDGSNAEKAYAAKYFYYVNFENASNILFELLKNDNQHVKENAAQSLGQMNDETTYNYLIEKLKSDDDWSKVDAAQLLASYGNKDAIIPMLESMSNSNMSEHIAGEIATLTDIHELIEYNDEKIKVLALNALNNIISGIPDIWPLEIILDFKIYDCIDKLVHLSFENQDSVLSGKYALILLKIKYRMNLFQRDSQYTFDQEKYVVNELKEICKLINGIEQDFWHYQTKKLYDELRSDDENAVLSALNIIRESKPDDYLPHLLELIYENFDNDLLLCEGILTVEELGGIEKISTPESLIANIKDKNLAALITNAFNSLK